MGTLFFMVMALFAACSDTPTEPEEPEPTRSYRMGSAGLVPAHWPQPAAADWNRLFDTVIPEYGELLGVHTGWNEGQLDTAGVPQVIGTAFQGTSSSGVEPYVALGVEPDRLTQQQADTYFLDHGDAFIDVLVTVAERHEPSILLIGVEINRFYEKSPQGFRHFLDVYRRAYEAIKEASPGTMVGSNFQYEYLIGEARRSNRAHQPHWEILEDFAPRMDLVTFSVYPFLEYDRPGDIPLSYLQPIVQHTSRPLMITETGWPSQAVAGQQELETSEQVQADYLEKLVEMIDPLPFDGLVWSFQHDIETGPAGGIFNHISLRANGGSPKEAYNDWRELVAIPVE